MVHGSSLNFLNVILMFFVSTNKLAYHPAVLFPHIYNNVIRIPCQLVGKLSNPIRYYLIPWSQSQNFVLSPVNTSGLVVIGFPK